MKQKIRRGFLYGLVFVTALFPFAFISAYAAGNMAFLDPASGTAKPGGTFTISVDGSVGNSWLGTNGVVGTMNFPANLLKVKSISRDGATFPSGDLTFDNTGGKIEFNLNCGWWCGANNQSVHLFTVTFEALKDGTANITFGTVAYTTGVAGTIGGTYTIATPKPKPTPKPTPKPKPTTKPKPSPSPKPITTPSSPSTPTTTPKPIPEPSEEETPEPNHESDGGLLIENVTVTMTREENNVSWSVNNPEAKSVFLYGKKKGELDKDGVVTKDEDGRFVVELTDLELGTFYHFMIKAATIDNLQGANYTGTFTTRGYPVQLTIQHNGLLIPGAKVEIDGRVFTANSNAIILTELSDGQHKAIITPPNSTRSYTVSFTVAKKEIPASGNPDLQSLLLNIQSSGRASGLNGSMLPILGGVAAITLAGGLVGFIIIKKRRATDNSYENADIDRDLLISNYGNIENHRANTPEPQLDLSPSTSTPPPPTPPTNTQSLPPSEQQTSWQPRLVTVPPESPPEYDSSPPRQATSPTPQEEFQSTAEPPIEEPLPAPELTAPVTHNEEYAPDVMRVEASNETEAEAIYNPEKGELAIIHRNSHAPNVSASPATPNNTSPIVGNISDSGDSNLTKQPPVTIA